MIKSCLTKSKLILLNYILTLGCIARHWWLQHLEYIYISKAVKITSNILLLPNHRHNSYLIQVKRLLVNYEWSPLSGLNCQLPFLTAIKHLKVIKDSGTASSDRLAVQLILSSGRNRVCSYDRVTLSYYFSPYCMARQLCYMWLNLFHGLSMRRINFLFPL